ncbi:zinc finger protein 385D isoform X1 [Pygocentrus nattereri]|uniref:C2H2-type domain-containing protein n=1 Tax=Pygocentrus nattereri TaxID=42514 RepID=A0A3B4BXD1_PYGNA|nr:zinc finger protein 385D isoform X1 [Pygocentrus nattereri]
MESSSMFLGNVCQSGLLPLVRAPLPLQSSLRLKQILPFTLDASPLSLVPGFSSMDPVQKAVLHHTFGVAASAKKKHASCNVCQLRFNSQSQALAHYKGTKHAKRLKSLDAPKCKQKSLVVARENASKEPSKSLSLPAPLQNGTDWKEGSPVPPSPVQSGSSSGPAEAQSTSAAPAAGGEESPCQTPGAPQSTEQEGEPEPETEKGETEEEKARRLLYCSLCKVAVNSPSQLEAHNSGTKHKTMLEARNGNGSIKSFPRPGVKSKLTTPTGSTTGLQNKTFHCETCDVHVNSETQLKQHISSRRHKDRAAGKPAKPKYSPYTKTQRGQTKQQTQVKLPLGKDLCQPLTATIVPSHLAAVAAAAAAVGSAFPLRANHNPSVFQTQSLPAALLRPAPGPIRTSHAPVLFAPY